MTKELEIPTLEDYENSLKYHDWYYEYSDCYSVYDRGSTERWRLRNISEATPEHKALYEKYKAAHPGA